MGSVIVGVSTINLYRGGKEPEEIENLTFETGKRRAHKLIKGGIYKYHMQEAGKSKKDKIYVYTTHPVVNLTGQEFVWVHDTLL
jgi:uncharacterized cupin superfamily protein